MPLRSVNWTEALLPGLYSFFDIGFRMRPSLIPSLYNVATSARSKEENVGIGGVSVDAWDVYEQSGKPGSVDWNKGYTATYTHKEFVVDLDIERKLVDDDQYAVTAADRSRRMGISAAQKMEIDGASVFNNAFTSTFAGPDGVELCDASHPHSPDATGTTQSNFGALSLTKENLATVRQTMMVFTDDKGNRLGTMPDTLLVPIALEDTALQLVNSFQLPGTGNNDINPRFGQIQVVTWNQLTDTDAWFLIDSVGMRQALRWYNRVPLEISLKSNEATRAVYQFYMRYSFGWDDWRWVYGCNPS